jgi:predicted  nucleic acid-binding Zn-ribbon protein
MSKSKPGNSRFRSAKGATRKPENRDAGSAATVDTARRTTPIFDDTTWPQTPPSNKAGDAPRPAGDAQKLRREHPGPAEGSGAEVAPPAAVPPEVQELVSQLDRQLNVALDAVGALRQSVEEAGAQRRELLEEARTVNRNYKELVDKIAGERDGLARELRQARSQFSADAEAQAEAFAAIQQELKKERREAQQQVRQADDEIRQRNARIGELEMQLDEALASRDRIAKRVREVEAHLEQAVLPLREDVERARAREARVRDELETAREEIAALKLLARGPAGR